MDCPARSRVRTSDALNSTASMGKTARFHRSPSLPSAANFKASWQASSSASPAAHSPPENQTDYSESVQCVRLRTRISHTCTGLIEIGGRRGI